MALARRRRAGARRLRRLLRRDCRDENAPAPVVPIVPAPVAARPFTGGQPGAGATPRRGRGTSSRHAHRRAAHRRRAAPSPPAPAARRRRVLAALLGRRRRSSCSPRAAASWPPPRALDRVVKPGRLAAAARRRGADRSASRCSPPSSAPFAVSRVPRHGDDPVTARAADRRMRRGRQPAAARRRRARARRGPGPGRDPRRSACARRSSGSASTPTARSRCPPTSATPVGGRAARGPASAARRSSPATSTRTPGPAVFYRIGELRRGDKIVVVAPRRQPRALHRPGQRAVPEGRLPDRARLRPHPGPTLRLITCSGDVRPRQRPLPRQHGRLRALNQRRNA